MSYLNVLDPRFIPDVSFLEAPVQWNAVVVIAGEDLPRGASHDRARTTTTVHRHRIEVAVGHGHDTDHAAATGVTPVAVVHGHLRAYQGRPRSSTSRRR